MLRAHMRIYGIVQGVGFRPFVARIATRENLTGSVCNKGPYVEIFVSGNQTQLDAFVLALKTEAPERSMILKIEQQMTNPVQGETAFVIITSAKEKGQVFVSPDIATCDACSKELFDPTNKRYLHPFINCTACGPRLTILDSMPYDRKRTSMSDFPLCPDCEYEYTHMETRRYHAQPVCCNSCGPELYTLGTDKRMEGKQAILAARRVIREGGIIAIKGIGGFHLCCDATNSRAIQRLRSVKNRPTKPFAIMIRDIQKAKEVCEIGKEEEIIMTGPQKPILLLKKKRGAKLSSLIAPENPNIGVMLPYAPVQMLLFHYPGDAPLSPFFVMTSGNRKSEPLCHNDREALKDLAPICDLILSNNRTIRMRADDSIMQLYEKKPSMIRRSRGYAPLPIIRSKKREGTVLGIGGELKNSFTLGSNDLLYPSPYVGDLGSLTSIEALKAGVIRMERLLEIEPQIVACDLHPRYNSASFAKALGLPVVTVQHHFAHIVSCMAENDYEGEVIGVSFDGTGYGTDHTIWGGEFLLCSTSSFSRIGSITPFTQAGGDLSSTQGWRIAMALLLDAFDTTQARAIAQQLSVCSPQKAQGIMMMIKNKINSITSTSCGRLFDGVSALLSLKSESTFEGEASMQLQFTAEHYRDAQSLNLKTSEAMKAALANRYEAFSLINAKGKHFVLNTTALFKQLTLNKLSGETSERLALDFHLVLAFMIREGCRKSRADDHLSTVALSGGVFQNMLLLDLTKKLLEEDGFTVLIHSRVPANDGGISLGQAVVAMEKLQEVIKA